MRLSGLVVAAILLVSATLQASSSAGAASSGSSHSSAGSGGSASAHVSSPSFSGSSRGSASASNARTHALRPAATAKPEKKSFFAFWGRKKPIQPALASCSIPMGRGWKGFGCATPTLFNNCTALANLLAEQRRQMQDQNDYSQSLRYRLLHDQYDECLMHSRWPFGAYAYSALLLDTP